MMGIVQHLVRQPGFNYPAPLHDHQPMPQKARNGKIVGDDDGGNVEFGNQPAQEIQQARLNRNIKTARRFIHEHEARFGD